MVFYIAESRTGIHGHTGNISTVAKVFVQIGPRIALGAFRDAHGVLARMSLRRQIRHSGSHAKYIEKDQSHSATDSRICSITGSEHVGGCVHANVVDHRSANDEHRTGAASTRC